ncbi:MAG TPA: hypothetical protein VMB81_04775, partial [Candidatus Sulfotelmatobacter sp.]|nr:hypothetical protein [Candidatus Sulfotelmatobacter sp.]
MDGYWAKVLSKAWGDTKGTLGWNQKTAAAVIVALASLVPLGLTTGLPAVKEHGVQYLWYGLPFLIAALFLFAWNFVSAQGDLY